jgi:hypothetical protein
MSDDSSNTISYWESGGVNNDSEMCPSGAEIDYDPPDSPDGSGGYYDEDSANAAYHMSDNVEFDSD